MPSSETHRKYDIDREQQTPQATGRCADGVAKPIGKRSHCLLVSRAPFEFSFELHLTRSQISKGEPKGKIAASNLYEV